MQKKLWIEFESDNKVLDLGAMANPMFKMKGPNMINDSFAPHFPLKHAQKDMKYVQLPPQTSVITASAFPSNFLIYSPIDHFSLVCRFDYLSFLILLGLKLRRRIITRRLALDLATSLGVSLPTTSASDAQYQSVLAERGDEDFSAVYVASKKAKKNP